MVFFSTTFYFILLFYSGGDTDVYGYMHVSGTLAYVRNQGHIIVPIVGCIGIGHLAACTDMGSVV